MQYLRSTIIVYHGDGVYFLEGHEIKDKFRSELIYEDESICRYNIIDDVYIDSISYDSNNQINFELDKIENITINKHDKNCYHIYFNEHIFDTTNLVFFNNIKKNIYADSDLLNIEKCFILQNINNPLNYQVFDSYDGFELTKDFGFLVGYWLLRGGFQRIDKVDCEQVSWSGREFDIEVIKKIITDQPYLVKPFKDNKSDILVLINSDFYEFFKTHFKNERNKTFPNWLFLANNDFILGFFYGIIAANSYISYDKKKNFYLAVKIMNSNLITNINRLFEFRFKLFSRVIGAENNYLSFKITNKIYDLIKSGTDEKYFSLEHYENIKYVESKEIFYQNFKILPWYKFKVTKEEESTNTYTLGLVKNDMYMLDCGFFVSV